MAISAGYRAVVFTTPSLRGGIVRGALVSAEDAKEFFHSIEQDPLMFSRKLFAAAGIAAAGMAATSAHAVALVADGQWATFSVQGDVAPNLNWVDVDNAKPLSFTFTVPAGFVGKLTVVDGGTSGDEFQVTNGIAALGNTSLAVNNPSLTVFDDFSLAMTNNNFSRAVFSLSAGSYSISGNLSKSALSDTGEVLNTTIGGISLTVSAVPEPATVLSMLAGLGLLAGAVRRRSV
jgi:hypothetical protein